MLFSNASCNHLTLAIATYNIDTPNWQSPRSDNRLQNVPAAPTYRAPEDQIRQKIHSPLIIQNTTLQYLAPYSEAISSAWLYNKTRKYALAKLGLLGHLFLL